MALSVAVIFIRIVRCIGIVLLVSDARWMLSITAYANNIPEDCSVCGIGIVNGSWPSRGGMPPENTVKYPWMVSVGTAYSIRSCLGAIIDAFHILTAAHCVENDEGVPGPYVRVHFQNEDLFKGANFEIDTVVSHPLYDLTDSESTGITIAQYDIALVKLKRRIKCYENKNPICLPHADLKLNIGERNIFTGWSLPHPDYGALAITRKAFIKNLNFSECINGVPEAEAVEDHMLCQGGTPHRMCHGDSGAPLIKKINETYYVVGIASSETNATCSLSGPMIFTDVVKFLDWIQNNNKTTLSLPEPSERTSTPQTVDNTGNI